MPTRVLAQRRVHEGLDQRLYENNTAILADTLHLEALSLHNFSGTLLTPARVCEELAAKRIDYFVWAATNKMIKAFTMPSDLTLKALVRRVIDQLFLELASAIKDRMTGPHVIRVSLQRHDDISSIINSARRLHKAFTEQGVPRDLVIVSIPATEAGIQAAQLLEREGKLTSLCFVSSLVHAQACVEAGVSAISVSVGPLLDMYERKRKSVSHKLNDNPGIEAIQSILAYFRVNNIKTKVLGMDFSDVAQIGLFSNCDAVCVSAAQADRLRWSRAPSASIDLEEEPQVIMRAKQAKYPTSLLTMKGGFSTWFSPESRSLAVDTLHESLNKMQGYMAVLEHAVEVEVIRRVKLEKSLSEIKPGWGHLSTRSADEKEVILPQDHLAARDDVF